MFKKTIVFYFFLFLILCLIGSFPSVKAKKQSKYSVPVKVHKVEKQEGEMFVNAEFDLSKLNLKKREQLKIRLVLKNERDSIELPLYVFHSKKRHKIYLRSLAFGEQQEEYQGAKVFRLIREMKESPYTYTVRIPYQDWMKNAQLYVQKSSCPGCQLPKSQYSEFIWPLEKEADSLHILNPVVTFVMPASAPVKARKTSESAYLKFPSGSAVIKPNYKNNDIELRKVRRVIEELLYDEDISISKISIQGLASIEGSFKTNLDLSAARAKAFEEYLRNTYKLPLSLFETTWIGEDWEGLISLIEKGTMLQKERILNIISETGVFDGREKQLMDLEGGDPYRFMFENYFPQLRKVDYTIEFSVKHYNIEEEGVKILREHPNYLSARELYILSEGYERSSDEFKDIMDISITNFPTDLAVNINAAATYILRSKYEVAEHYLLSAGSSAPTFNNRGVILMLKGRYEEAKELLVKAKLLGSSDAEHNLKELEKVLGDL